jgi:hypothetical protein
MEEDPLFLDSDVLVPLNNSPPIESITSSSSTSSLLTSLPKSSAAKVKIDLHRYFRIVNLQLDVCKVFSELIKNKNTDPPPSIDKTLFGNMQTKCGMLASLSLFLCVSMC